MLQALCYSSAQTERCSKITICKYRNNKSHKRMPSRKSRQWLDVGTQLAISNSYNNRFNIRVTWSFGDKRNSLSIQHSMGVCNYFLFFAKKCTSHTPEGNKRERVILCVIISHTHSTLSVENGNRCRGIHKSEAPARIATNSRMNYRCLSPQGMRQEKLSDPYVCVGTHCCGHTAWTDELWVNLQGASK